MKKFLLSIFAVLFAFAGAQAQETVTFTFKDLYGSSTLSSIESKTLDGITISYAKNSPQYAPGYNKDGTMRLYYDSNTNNGNSATFTAESGKKITSVVVTASSTSYTPDVKYIVDGGSAITGAWNNTTLTIAGIEATTVSIQNVGTTQLRTKVISVTYETSGGNEGGEVGGETPETPAAPTLTTSCSFDDAMTVEITDVAEGATAYYSLNNETDWVEGTSVEITETTTVYAKAVKDELSSDVVSETYTKNTPVTPPAEGEVVDVLTSSDFTATTDTYTDFSGISKESGAVYAGQSAKSTNGGGIQLRSKNSNSGIVTTKSGGKVKSVTIEVESGTNKLDIYGKNTPYTAASDLYDTSKQGTKLGTLSANGTLAIEGDYEYIGLRSNNGALYLTSVSITWDTSAGVTPVAPNAPVLTESQSFSGSMTVTITSDATVYYTTDESDPATSATRVEYTDPFEITATTTVKAVAVNEVGESEVAEATYTKVELINLNGCSVADAIEAYGNGQTGNATIVGYIVGTMVDNEFVPGSEGATAANLVIADNPDETDASKCIPVQLSSGTIRDVLNLLETPANLGRKVTLSGSLEKYFTVAGLKSLKTAGLYWNVSEAGYATLYLGYKVVIPETVKAYLATGVADKYVALSEVTGILPANTGLILEGEGEHLFNITSSAATADVAGNLLKGSVTDEYVAGDAYVLGNVDGVGLYKAVLNKNEAGEAGTTHFKNNANKAYLPASALTPAQQTAAFYGFDWDGTTGISEVKGESGNVKGIYDLTGRRVETITAPGIYVVNGKKVLVK